MVTVFRPNRATALQAALALAAVAAVTLLMLPVRERLDKAHVALLFLIVVLVTSARGGRAVALFTAVLTFLCFNWFFLEPYHTFVIADPLDWLVLFTFLTTAGIAAQLVHHVQVQAREARARASEIERLSALGAETLNVGRAEDALGAIASVIRTTLHVERAEVYLQDPREDEPKLLVRSPRERGDLAPGPPPPLVVWVARAGLSAAELTDGTSRLQEAPKPPSTSPPALEAAGARTLMLPLLVRGRTVGVLRLIGHEVIQFETGQQQFLDALSYYAALGVERVRLTAQAEHASALAEADRLKDALLAAVSHDLRTPLTTIKATAVEIAASGDARGRAIEREANRLNELVVDLLDLSKLQAGAVKLEPQINEAADLIGAALQQLSAALAGR
ncbi:MAG TPA: DUF4118 domain-containing protein, partial [Longimicrobiales bacterium]|nr:DUF4118 domain-containing protein [Longimicrobiales bacterium]